MSSLWQEVWNAHDPPKIGDFVTEDFVLLGQVQDLRLEVVGSFQNEDGSRVASRWVAHGRSNGLLGTEPDGRPVCFSGTAVWAVREDGGLRHAWVERSAWELTRQLTGTAGR
ncbi:nuclear transport factor 2 family protein [Actinacidiphila glaucinigra]|uniref:SnoaL-like polyketide cyclase n=1 Tax=Actinacidiphila glaucinigra TaxID=235986 RepID=A0A239DSP0_9ACTN|nr:hypothetical protein [Actinacidiphila glaucinigra]SNS34584.1 hypothetical protein SAMN05216252_105106 [Actinacidiphila glaucinigra]